MQARRFLGIDVGTTATKAVVLAESGEPLRRVRVAHASGQPPGPGRVDPRTWWDSVREACRALDAHGLDLAGLGLSVHCPVAVPMDASGRHLSAGYRYEAPGLTRIVEALGPLLAPEEIRRSGNRVSPATFIAGTYLLLQEQEPEVAAELRTLGSVGTYIGQRLTGRGAVDPSQASYFGPFDTVGTWDWQDGVLARLGIPRHALPPVLGSSQVLGELTEDAAAVLGLRPGVPVVVGAGDTACAALAAGIDGSGARLLTLGTTHVVTEHGSAPAEDQRHLQRAFVRPGQWLRHGTSNGGLALSVAARSLGYGQGGDAVSSMVGRALSCDAAAILRAPFFVPHVRPERAPLWLEEPRSGFLGLAPDTDEASLAWAAVEGVLFVDRIVAETSAQGPHRGLLLAGDASGTGAFTQLAADLFGSPLTVSGESHLPALGAAMLAAGRPVHLRHTTRRATPRPGLAGLVEERWEGFRATRARFLAA